MPRGSTETLERASRSRKPLRIEVVELAGETTMRLHGRIDHHGVVAALADAQAALEAVQGNRLAIDLAWLNFLDSAGALALLQLERYAERRGVAVRLVNTTHEQQALIDLIDRQALGARPLIEAAPAAGATERLGALAGRVVGELVDIVAFTGRLLAAAARSLVRPRTVRWDEVWAGIQRIGVGGLPIIGLLSFLMGFIIGAMAVSNLRQLSMNTLISAVVAVAMVQEFGPLITSLVTAGRIGSAFAAEIATMTVHEEVDALAAMGYEPIAFLGVPKLFATMVAVPLITFYADALGILGGLVVAATQLQVTAYPYFALIAANVSLFSFVVATIKTFLFSLIIATVGCRHGFAARGGAEGVGRATTAAVVAGILLIIFTDFLFASMVNYLG